MTLRPLAVVWMVTIAVVVVGLIVGAALQHGGMATAVGTLGWLTGIVLSVLTIPNASTDAELVRVLPYRIVIIGSLLAGVATVIGVGHTVWADGAVGFFATASVGCIAVILAWRAFVAPSPRRAALVGAVATVGSMLAVIIDVQLYVDSSDYVEHGLEGVMAIGVLAMWILGPLTSLAALTLFAPRSNLPPARAQ